MKARPPWTGWSRNASAASPSPAPPPPPPGPATPKSIASISLIPPATWISPSKSSAPFACWTGPSPFSIPSPASSRSPKRCGARRINTASRASPSSTRWTKWARILTTSSAPSASASARLPFPLGREDNFIGCIDFLEQQVIVWLEETLGAKYEVFEVEKLWDPAFVASRPDVAAALKASAIDKKFYEDHRNKVIEYIAEHDDEVLDKYLSEGTLSLEEMPKSIRKSTLAMKIVPVLAGSAFKNKGIQPLLDAVVDYLPSPLDVPPVEGVNPDNDEPELRRAADDQPFSALAFKIMSDPFVGHVTYIRVYSGVLKAGSYVYN